MDKPFTTIEQQIEILQQRGVQADGETETLLLKEGYYSVVNGYKTPFLDHEASRHAGHDVYREGTRFSDIHSLFLFDRDLRETTFHYLVRAEAVVRTVCSYTFSEAHPEIDAYLCPDNYCDADEYREFGLKGYGYNRDKLIDKLRDKMLRSQREFIVHYRENHDCVPLWVLANDMTFGNLEHFFNLMKPGERLLVCKRIVDVTGNTGSQYGYFNPREARVGLAALVSFRNLCAHDERLYCAKEGSRRNADYVQMLAYLTRYLSANEHHALIDSVARLVSHYSSKSEVVLHILKEMGFRNMAGQDE